MSIVVITSCQLRMARAALRISIEELAKRSGVSDRTIRRLESAWGVPPNVTTDTLARLQNFFAHEGMTFIPDDNMAGPGVRFDYREKEGMRA